MILETLAGPCVVDGSENLVVPRLAASVRTLAWLSLLFLVSYLLFERDLGRTGLLSGAYFSGKQDKRTAVIMEWSKDNGKDVYVASSLLVCIGPLRNSPLSLRGNDACAYAKVKSVKGSFSFVRICLIWLAISLIHATLPLGLDYAQDFPPYR